MACITAGWLRAHSKRLCRTYNASHAYDTKGKKAACSWLSESLGSTRVGKIQSRITLSMVKYQNTQASYIPQATNLQVLQHLFAAVSHSFSGQRRKRGTIQIQQQHHRFLTIPIHLSISEHADCSRSYGDCHQSSSWWSILCRWHRHQSCLQRRACGASP